ncbi:hypothetical protein SLA_3355 [Streptomyces laurentii]|uniref:Uncharacterized protein n=1 Tax=Streptomyces laurentii TaxID=39478 RepID=A0A160P0X7_STRLU|nr:hypothetical protein SLA_3355 [Streptomyces laurentii]
MPDHADHDVTKTRFEEELGEALRRAGAGFVTDDRRALATGGLARGRRRLRLHRTATIGGALALVVIGAGGVYGGSLLGAGHAGASAAGAFPKGASAAGTGPAAGDTGGAPDPEEGGVPAADIAAVLQANTPAGTWTFDAPSGAGGSAVGVYDDGKGKAGVSAGIYRAGASAEAGIGQVTCPDKVLVPYDDCTEKALPGGDRMMIFQGYEYPDKRVPTKWWHANLLTADGFILSVSEYNAPTEKDSGISRQDPPFDPAQLRTLITADGWRPLMKKVARPDKGSPKRRAAPVAKEVDGTRVTATLRSLLPKGRGLKAVGDGEGYLIVDDGDGRSFVQINVQSDMGRHRAELFSGEGVTTEPDGTLVKVTKGSGEKGVEGSVMWTTDTLAKDGFRVVISAFNAGSQLEPPTRAEPALTTAQLKEIATSPKWRSLAAK